MLAHNSRFREYSAVPTPDAFDPSILVFAALAVFVVWRLRSVLGVRVDRDAERRPPYQGPSAALGGAGPGPLPGAPPAHETDAAPATGRWVGVAEPGSANWAALDALAAADPRFNAQAFLSGARKAYEMIVTAFAKGDRETLRPLLSDDVFRNFDAAIAAREQAGETMKTAVVAIEDSAIDSALIDANAARLKARFVSKLMSERRDRSGAIVEGGLGHTSTMKELWTFERALRTSDPNWKLVATESVA
jgi:predicted lipid-binding transport protein (Tim44 family)